MSAVPLNLASPSLWGSAGWKMLHAVASTYPLKPTPQDQVHYRQFFTSLGPVLPCKLCRPHYIEYLEKHPLERALGSRTKLVNYVFRFHNHVNRRIGKRIYRKEDLPEYFGQK